MLEGQRQAVRSSPFSGIRHRLPGLARGQRLALLQQFNRMPVRGADEGHLPVARRPVDGDARLHQPFAERVDIVHLIGKMTEEARLPIVLGIPVIGVRSAARRDRVCSAPPGLRRRRCQEYQGEAALFAVASAHLPQPQFVTIKIKRVVEVAHAQHGVQKSHLPTLSLSKPPLSINDRA